MRGKLKEEGNYELYKTNHGHDILNLDDENYFAFVEGDQGDVIIKSDSDHKKEKTVSRGKYYYADFKDDPEFKDMRHLFMEDGEKFSEIILPEGLPKESDYQKKLVRTDEKIPKDKVREHVKGKGNKGSEDQYEGKKEGLRNKSKEELYDKAQNQDIEGRSKMDKEELIKKLQEGGESSEDLKNKTKEELYDMARKKDIEGRSKMDKGELAKKLKKEQKS
ncbi:MAG: Rho termination factor N-terminal domain-containing protein [Salinimicrobium sp.]